MEPESGNILTSSTDNPSNAVETYKTDSSSDKQQLVGLFAGRSIFCNSFYGYWFGSRF